MSIRNVPPRLQLVGDDPGVSRYAVLATALRTRLLQGEWPPGSAMPPEQVLAAEHGVALGTMRRALSVLADEGLIERVHGRGTFVRQGLSGAPMLRFFRFGQGAGQVPQSRILSREQVGATRQVARLLGVAPGEPCIRIQRLRLLDGQPCLHEDMFLPLPLFEPLLHVPTADWPDLLYPFFATRCQVHVHRAVDEIGFGQFSAGQARHLALSPGHPCAVVTRTAFDLQGRPVEARTSRGDANAFHYTVTIT